MELGGNGVQLELRVYQMIINATVYLTEGLITYTGLVVELEHRKIKTRLTDEKFPSVKGECEI